MKQRQMTLKDVMWVYIRKLHHRPRMSDPFLADILMIRLDYNTLSVNNIIYYVLFSALRDQLASLDRHWQLTRCFSAVAERLEHI